QGLDQLVVSSDRVTADPAGLCAIRQWLHGGGRLWVRLDRVSPATVSLLLGEAFPCTVVNRTELTQWQLLQSPRAEAADEEASDALEGPVPVRQTFLRIDGKIDTFEPPVEMVCILAPGVKAAHTINGWPASFWRRSGRGKVLFTTLGPRGWVD